MHTLDDPIKIKKRGKLADCLMEAIELAGRTIHFFSADTDALETEGRKKKERSKAANCPCQNLIIIQSFVFLRRACFGSSTVVLAQLFISQIKTRLMIMLTILKLKFARSPGDGSINMSRCVSSNCLSE